MSRGTAAAAIRLLRDDSDYSAAARAREPYFPSPAREKRIVSTQAYAVTRPPPGAALSYYDRAYPDFFPTETLDSESLSRAVPPVLRAALSFFSSHLGLPPFLYARPTLLILTNV